MIYNWYFDSRSNVSRSMFNLFFIIYFILIWFLHSFVKKLFYNLIYTKWCKLFDGLTFFAVSGDIPICSPDQPFLFPSKVKNRNTRKRCEICQKLIKKTPEWRQWGRSSVCNFDFEHISHLFIQQTKVCWDNLKWNNIRFKNIYLKIHKRSCKHLRWCDSQQ